MVQTTNQIAAGLKCCPECSAQMPNSAGFCPGCGHSMANESGGVQKHGIGRDRLLGACAYCTFLPAIAFLLLEPYRRNSFVRFHSVQCLLFWLVSIVAAVLVRLLILFLVFVPSLARCWQFCVSRFRLWLHYSCGSFSWQRRFKARDLRSRLLAAWPRTIRVLRNRLHALIWRLLLGLVFGTFPRTLLGSGHSLP